MTDTLLRPGEACLMHGMAERLGADVVRAAASGEIAPEDLSKMETGCGQCTQHDACILWLLEHQGHQEQAPDYCLNAQKLYYVRALQNPLLAAE
ncbi:DUF6455 family protein [Celeribacter ethanolicus]|uniref:DUF6455 domain-containing protein n=1 Tax=Celeribacter ethanolicus TaxID=1758178 RepID=A0A291GGN4_9RHOB|nr:DUF6455 family protein [Celeribacter ethanolicus]ATG49341.1 hypothetical protein CEW89_18220 [Celeribacter ethanolicus]TNE67389.1 MAG: hypothetical protein EP336_07625 [Paracoccaceae bacterium]